MAADHRNLSDQIDFKAWNAHFQALAEELNALPEDKRLNEFRYYTSCYHEAVDRFIGLGVTTLRMFADGQTSEQIVRHVGETLGNVDAWSDTTQVVYDAALARALAAAAPELLVAHRERDELKAENERLNRRLYPGQGEGYANEVERLRYVTEELQRIAEAASAERDDLRVQLAAAVELLLAGQARIGYLADENPIWNAWEERRNALLAEYESKQGGQ